MTYRELKEYYTKFQLGEIHKLELAIAIHMWQRANGIQIEDKREQ